MSSNLADIAIGLVAETVALQRTDSALVRRVVPSPRPPGRGHHALATLGRLCGPTRALTGSAGFNSGLEQAGSGSFRIGQRRTAARPRRRTRISRG